MARGSESEWSERVARWRTSGLTTRQFAAAEGVNASSLAWWKWKLAKQARPKERRRRDRARSADASLEFVQIRAASGAPLEVALVNGAVIRVPADADVHLVARLATALSGGAR